MNNGATVALIRRCQPMGQGPSAEACYMARLCLLDWIGVTLAGANEPEVDWLVADLLEDGGGDAPLIGRTEYLGLRDAVLVNGFASHLIDYDDGLPAMSGHSSVAILPALFVLGAARGVTGAQLCMALVASVEMAGCIGRLMAPDHYRRGFHATGTVGAVAAAFGCAQLMGLDEPTTAYALGLAGTRAAGLKASFGTSGKPLHAGWAALIGLTAARWAARGLTGAADIIGGAQGFAEALDAGGGLDTALAPAAHGAHIMDVRFKRFASCGVTHPTIDALTAALAHLPQGAQVDHLAISIGSDADRICNIQEPKSGLQAKFSLSMVAALLLAGRDLADPSTFSDACVADPAMVALRDRVTVSLEDGWPATRCAVTVTAAGADMPTLARDGADHAADPTEQVHRKFVALAAPVLGSARTMEIVGVVSDLGDHDIAMLLAVLSLSPKR